MTNQSYSKNIISFIKESFSSEHRDFTTCSIKKAIFLLAIPMILEMSMESVFALVDMFFVGKLGTTATQIVGLTESCLSIIYSIAFGVGMAATAMVARRVGEKNVEQASRSGAQAIVLAIIISAIISFVGVFWGDNLLALMGAKPADVEYGSNFIRILLIGNIVIMMIHLMNGIFRGAGNAAIAMKSLGLANLCNIILCPICIHFWGLTGAAIATTTGRGIGVIYQLYNLNQGKGLLTLKAKYFKPDLEIIASLGKISFSSVMQFIIASGSWIAMTWLMAKVGKEETAGYTIAIRYIVFFILPSFGLSNAAATLVGQNLGAKQLQRAEDSVWQVAKYNGIFMGFVSVFFLLFAPWLIGFINTDKVVVETGTLALRVISLGYVFYGIGMTLMNAFNGAGDSKTQTFINLFWYWAFQVPIAYFVTMNLQWKAIGVFLAILVTEVFIAITGMIIFKKGKWKEVKI